MKRTLFTTLLAFAIASPFGAAQQKKTLTPQQKRARELRQKLKGMGITVKRADVAKSDAVEVRMDVVYAKYGDREMHLDLFIPKKRSEKTAAVLIVHGGGWLKGDRESFHALSMNLALRGYVAAAVEYRLGGEAKFPAAIHDCNAATRWLRANAEDLGVDPKRIAAVGGSAGGHLVGLMAAGSHREELQGQGGNSEQSSELQAAVVMAGPMQMTTGSVADRSRQQPEQSNSNRWIGKTIDEAPELYSLAAPFKQITDKTPPMLFQAGERDKPERNLQMRNALHKRGIAANVIAYRHGLHACWNQRPWFEPMAADVDDFLRSVFSKPGGERQPFKVGSSGNVIAFHDRVEITIGRLDEKKTKPGVSMPRLNNPIGKVYLKESKREVALTPGLTEWDITVPNSASGKTIVVETIGQPHLPTIPHIVSAAADGTITLDAHDSVTHGKLLRYEPQPHKNTVGYWANADDYVEWHFYAEKPGAYDFHILQGCGKGHGGSSVDAVIGDQTVSFTVEDTGHFQNFKDRKLGRFRIERPGVLTLKFIAKKKARVAVMDCRQVRLVPAK